jgi:hypothetical protein
MNRDISVGVMLKVIVSTASTASQTDVSHVGNKPHISAVNRKAVYVDTVYVATRSV